MFFSSWKNQIKYTLTLSLALFSACAHAKILSADADLKKSQISISCESGTKTYPIVIPHDHKDPHGQHGMDDFRLEDRPKIHSRDGLHIVMVEIAAHSSGTTLVYAVDSQCNKLWTTNLFSFNPATPLFEKDHIYLGAVGRVWKLNKLTGAVVWSHKDLYKKYKYNGLDRIKRNKDKIVYSKKLTVNDKTGALNDI